MKFDNCKKNVESYIQVGMLCHKDGLHMKYLNFCSWKCNNEACFKRVNPKSKRKATKHYAS